MTVETSYPVRFEAEYPEQLGRLSSAFRIILYIPVAIFLVLVAGQSFDFGDFSMRGFSG